jgi:FtsZ-binding cell division protein ZapB
VADPQIVAGVAAAIGTVISGSFILVGRKKDGNGNGVNLLKTVMDDKNREAARLRKELRDLQAQVDAVEAERDHLRYELDYAHARLTALGDPPHE